MLTALTQEKALRISDVALSASVSALLLIITFNNITDYDTNFQFVTHIMSMDEIQGSKLFYRSIPSTFVHHLAYIFIIGLELVAGGLTLAGALTCARKINTAPEVYSSAKAISILGLTISCVIWLFIFLAVAGEWFVMWLSKWNGQNAALRMFVTSFFPLLLLSRREK